MVGIVKAIAAWFWHHPCHDFPLDPEIEKSMRKSSTDKDAGGKSDARWNSHTTAVTLFFLGVFGGYFI